MAKIVVPDGTEGVAVNAVIGILTEQAGEKLDAPAKAEPAAAKPEPEKPAPEQKGEPEKAGPPEPSAPAAAKPAETPATAQEHGERLFASPLARRMARQAGIDLASLKGSGPNGRIVKADIEALGKAGAQPAAAPEPSAAAAVTPAPAPAPAKAAPAAPVTAPHKKIPNSSMRKVIARRCWNPNRPFRNFYVVGHFEIDALLKLRARSECEIGQGWAGRVQAFGQ